MSGKSAPYSRPGLSNNEFLLIICEAALGNARELKHSDYNASNLPAGSHSTKAVGRKRPDPSQSVKVEKDIELPLGQAQDFSEGGMCHNEYIIYNTNQVKMRYLVKCKLN